MKVYLVRITDEVNALNFARQNEVRVFETSKQQKQFIEMMTRLREGAKFEKRTCEFAANKSGICNFFNMHAWHD